MHETSWRVRLISPGRLPADPAPHIGRMPNPRVPWRPILRGATPRNPRCSGGYGRRTPLPSAPLRLAASVLLFCVVLPASAAAQDESSLRSTIERSRDRERELSGAVARLGTLVARAGREVAVVQGRLTEVEADLAAAEARLAATREELGEGRRRLVRLQRRHAAGRELLAAQLVADYKADEPDVVSFVLGADSFADLLERIAFAQRVRTRNAEILARVRDARVRTRHAAIALAPARRRAPRDGAGDLGPARRAGDACATASPPARRRS